MKKLFIFLLLAVFVFIIQLFTSLSHHLFVIGMNPLFAFLFILFFILVIIPGLLKFFKRLLAYFKMPDILNPTVLFASGALSFLISGFPSAMYFDKTTFDIHLHDTYYVIISYHIFFATAIALLIFAGVYYLYKKITGIYLNPTMGYMHFWITVVCIDIILPFAKYNNMAGMPRRYPDYGGFQNLIEYLDIPKLYIMIGLLIIAAQLLFVTNMVYSFIKLRRILDK